MNVEAWAKNLIDRGTWVFHVDTYAVGRATKFYDGKKRKYVSALNGDPVPGPVLELETGHALLAIPEKWLTLTKADVRFYQSLQEGVSALVVVAAKSASDSGVEMEKGFAMLTAVLRAQLAALEVTK